MGTLYRLTFSSGKQYIGITSGELRRRLNLHRFNSVTAKEDYPIHRAWRKYGEPVSETLDTCDDWATLCAMEGTAISRHRTMVPDGYNLTEGGEGTTGVIRTDEQRKRYSEARKGKPFAGKRFGFGDRHTEASRALISAAGGGRVFSAESRAKIGATKIGNSYGIGKKRTKEFIEKMSAMQKGKPKSDAARAAMSRAKKGRPWSMARRAAYEARASL